MVSVGLIVAAVVWHAWLASAGAGPPDGRQTQSQTAPPPAAERDGAKTAFFESVWVRVLRNVNTECKLCPSPGCLNKDWFGSSYQFQAVCWARGAKVGNTT
jgi:hypothetical protein